MPQWPVSVLRLTSQPFPTLVSQFANPPVHAMAQAPDTHDAVPFVPLQVVLQALQLLTLLLVLVSQPSA